MSPKHLEVNYEKLERRFKMMKDKRGIVANLSVLAYSIVAFAIIIGVGVVVLTRFGNSTPEANATTSYLATQLGVSGLAGWIPAVIALVIGLLFLAYFGFGGQGKKVR